MLRFANSLPDSEISQQFCSRSQVHTIVTTSIKICTRKRRHKFLPTFREVMETLAYTESEIGEFKTSV